MTREHQHPQTNFQASGSSTIRMRNILRTMTRKWYLFLITLAGACLLAFLYLRYTPPKYRVTASLMLNEERDSRISERDMILEGYGLLHGSQNIDNQIFVLSSWPMVSRTLEGLDFDIDYYIRGRIMTGSCYPDNPLRVVFDTTAWVPYNMEFSVDYVTMSAFHLRVAENEIFALDTIIEFGQKISIGKGSLFVMPMPRYFELTEQGYTIYFKIHQKEDLVDTYMNRLTVESVFRDGTIVTASLQGTNRTKDVDFLNRLIGEFMKSNLEKKNFEASRIIDFIDAQLVDVSDSLTITEEHLQDFRARNQVMDISAQGQKIIDQAVRLEDERARLNLEADYYEYLAEYLKNETTMESPVSPSSMGITDPMLTALMKELSEVQLEFYSGNIGDKSPRQAQLAQQLRNIKQSIQETLKGVITANRMAKEENEEQQRSLNDQARRLPVTERQLLGIERKFNLNEALYTYLLQRRAEAQISKASNAPDNEVVSRARASRYPVSPNKPMVYSLALLIGLMLPSGILVLFQAISDKITTEDELKMLTPLPVVGHIPHSNLKFQTVVLSDPQSVQAEAFRSLRTRMQFFTRESTNPVILVSSSIPGEGKTFVAVNLASAYSLTGKKTLLLGFDLRRPSLSPDFNLDYSRGISTYLIGQDSLADIIQGSGFQDLDIIPSGPVPPNPAELAASEKSRELFAELRKIYDFIIVDTSPFGVVSDGLNQAVIADANIFVVRFHKSMKRPLLVTLSESREMGIRGMSLLVNDYRSNKGPYKYTYNYRYKNYKQRAAIIPHRITKHNGFENLQVKTGYKTTGVEGPN
jgi:tyrosine-protein kinase Etk/Wzc